MFSIFHAIWCELTHLRRDTKALTHVTLFNFLITFEWLNNFWNIKYLFYFINFIKFWSRQNIYNIKRHEILRLFSIAALATVNTNIFKTFSDTFVFSITWEALVQTFLGLCSLGCSKIMYFLALLSKKRFVSLKSLSFLHKTIRL